MLSVNGVEFSLSEEAKRAVCREQVRRVRQFAEVLVRDCDAYTEALAAREEIDGGTEDELMMVSRDERAAVKRAARAGEYVLDGLRVVTGLYYESFAPDHQRKDG